MSSGPYITTVLETQITLKPNQMNNQIYKNLKDNLIKQLEGKCYRNYGYIVKIYEILKYSEGIVIPENPTASAVFGVRFSCRLCNPLKRKQIICKIHKINNAFINAQNGPITVIVPINSITGDIFYQDTKTNKLMAKQKTGPSFEITPGKYIRISIIAKQFNDMATIIMATGELVDIVTNDEEIKKSYSDEYGVGNERKYINFDKYIEDKSEDYVKEEADKEDTENTDDDAEEDNQE